VSATVTLPVRGSVMAAYLFVLANVLDLVITLYALKIGLSEGNPVMAWVISFGAGWFIAVKLGLSVLIAWWLVRNRSPRIPYYAGLVGLVVVWNVVLVARHVS
jgi:hypothetical protein